MENQTNPQANVPIPPPMPPMQTPTPPPSSSGSQNTGMAVLAYLGILIIIPFLTDAKNDPFVKFHIKQGLVLFISEIIATVIIVVPFFGWMLAPLIWLASFILLILGIINVVNGQMKELPVIGQFARNFNF